MSHVVDLVLEEVRLDEPCGRDSNALLRGVKLLHLLPSLLFSADGRVSRAKREAMVRNADLVDLVQWQLQFARRGGTRRRSGADGGDDEAALWREAASLVALQGGVRKCAQELTSEPMAPGDETTWTALLGKHPHEDAGGIDVALQAARTDVIRLHGAAGARQDVSFCTPELMAATIRNADPLSAAGPSGLRYCHLQAALRASHGEEGPFAEALARLWRALLSAPASFPPEFWVLHSAATLIALGEKRRPIAMCDTLRRAVSSATMAALKTKLAAPLRAAGQFGIGVPAGVEHVATRTRLRHEAGEWVFTLDCRNAFNSLLRSSMFGPLAEVAPEALEYLAQVYGGVPPSLLFRMDDGAVRVIHSRRGPQQGDPWGPASFAAGIMPVIRAMHARESPRGVEALSLWAFLDDMTAAARALDRATANSILHLKALLLERGLELVPGKSWALPPPGHAVTEAERSLLAEVGISLATEGGVVTVGVPVGSDDFVRSHAEGSIARLRCPQLARHLAGMAADHTQAALLVATQSLSRRLGYLARTVDPRLLGPTARRYDALCSWTLEQVMDLPGAAPADVFLADMVEEHLVLALHQRMQTQMSVRSGGLHLASAAHTSEAAYVAGALVTLPSLLADLLADPTAAGFRAALPGTATVQALWAALRSLGPGAGNRGLTAEQLSALLPPSWVGWALAPHFTCPGLDVLAAHDCPLPAAREGAPARPLGSGAQAGLTHQLNRLRFEHFRHDLLPTLASGGGAGSAAESAAQALARHRSQCGRGAMAWVAARPASPELVLLPSETRMALWRAVGIEHALQAPCPMRSCGAMDVTTRHARHCMRSGNVTRLHHSIRDTLQRQLKWVGVLAEREDPTYFTVGGLSMDLTVAAGDLRQGGVDSLVTHAALLDITVADPHAPCNVTGSALQDGSAAASAADRKTNHYRNTFDCASSTLWPMALESYGRWGQPAEQFFGAMAEHAVGGRESARWREKGAVLHRIRQVLAVALQRGLHRSVRGYRHVVDLARHRGVPAAAELHELAQDRRRLDGGW